MYYIDSVIHGMSLVQVFRGVTKGSNYFFYIYIRDINHMKKQIFIVERKENSSLFLFFYFGLFVLT
jgi:hypothetical protein